MAFRLSHYFIFSWFYVLSLYIWLWGTAVAESRGRWFDPSWCNFSLALGSTDPLTEMSTRNISWGKGGRCVRLITLPPSCAVVTKSGNFNFLEPSGPLQACNGTDLPLYVLVCFVSFCLIL